MATGHLVSAELATYVCVYQVVTPMHCFVIGEVDILRLSYTLMTVYVQRMVRGRNVCGKPVGVPHSRISGVYSSHYYISMDAYTPIDLSLVCFGHVLGYIEVSQSKVIVL